jgi:hypothetical protein
MQSGGIRSLQAVCCHYHNVIDLEIDCGVGQRLAQVERSDADRAHKAPTPDPGAPASPKDLGRPGQVGRHRAHFRSAEHCRSLLSSNPCQHRSGGHRAGSRDGQPGVLQIWEFTHRSSLQHLDNYTSLFIQLTSAPANRDATSLVPAQRISRDLPILPRYPEVQVQSASLHHPNFELRCANCKRAIRPYIDPLAHREPVLESQQ